MFSNLSSIISLKNKSISEYDKIVSWIAKSTIDTISEPLIEIINCSFKTGIVPDELKIAKVVPMYKAGAKMNSLTIDLFLSYHSFGKFLRKIDL